MSATSRQKVCTESGEAEFRLPNRKKLKNSRKTARQNQILATRKSNISTWFQCNICMKLYTLPDMVHIFQKSVFVLETQFFE